jgi:hypothetical protein
MGPWRSGRALLDDVYLHTFLLEYIPFTTTAIHDSQITPTPKLTCLWN